MEATAEKDEGEIVADNEELDRFYQRVKARHELKHDFVRPASFLRMEDDGVVTIKDAPLAGTLAEAFDLPKHGSVDLPYHGDGIFHSQLADFLPAPAFVRPYKYLLENEPDALAEVVNRLVHYKGDQNRLFRTYRPPTEDGARGTLRSMLSSRYGIIDNYPVLLQAMRVVKSLGLDARVRGSLTKYRMWLKFEFPSHSVEFDELDGYSNPHRTDEVPDFAITPDNPEIHAGFVLTNSETGNGAFEVRPRPVVQVCINGTTRIDDRIRKKHLGSAMENGIVAWSDEVRQMQKELVEQQVREAVETFVSEDYLEDVLTDFWGGENAKTLDYPEAALTRAANEMEIPEDEEEELLGYFMRGGDNRRSAIPQAVTAYAQHVENPDRRYELEAGAWSLDMASLDTPLG